ncbi:MAG: hypothetical protein ACR2PR_08095 [Pseudohongiellaceae bacterium]
MTRSERAVWILEREREQRDRQLQHRLEEARHQRRHDNLVQGINTIVAMHQAQLQVILAAMFR